MKHITITKPDDWHCHLRDGDFLSRTVADAAKQFGRIIVMPNLQPPVVNVANAQAYLRRITNFIAKDSSFKPLMTLYLTDQTTPEIIYDAKQSGIVYAVKLYPAHATTHSEHGVTNIKKLKKTLDAMQDIDLPLLIHGEVVDNDIDIFAREKVFIERALKPLTEQYPNLRIVLEHITTQDAVNFIQQASDNIAATITAHHLLLNRNDLLVGGIKPHYYCLPILKAQRHQQALINAALSGNKKFFLGTDSAPHAINKKETACGCAGIYTAHAAIELYAEFFAQHNALDKLEAFASFYGADFYKLPRNQEKITLVNEAWMVPEVLAFGNEKLVPFKAGEEIAWKLL